MCVVECVCAVAGGCVRPTPTQLAAVQPKKNHRGPPRRRAQSPKAKKRTASPGKEPPKRTRHTKKNRGAGVKRTGRFFSAESAMVGRQWKGWAKRIETGPIGLVPPLGNKMRVFPCQSGTRALLNRHVHPKWPVWQHRRREKSTGEKHRRKEPPRKRTT